MVDPDFLFIEIGHKDAAPDDNALSQVVAVMTRMVQQNPRVEIEFSYGGYDEDRRELWEIPEVIEVFQRLGRLSGLNDWRNAAKFRLSKTTIGVLALCGVFGKDHPYTVRLTGKADSSR